MPYFCLLHLSAVLKTKINLLAFVTDYQELLLLSANFSLINTQSWQTTNNATG